MIQRRSRQEKKALSYLRDRCCDREIITAANWHVHLASAEQAGFEFAGEEIEVVGDWMKEAARHSS
ncbi:hypothetical protein AB0H49_30975 [Nocardia sp. NPDC050713]|uniref:hypothetical protein n=1 Tax=Nocardia sp. NPDC050713 TaxID=3154511 RepID=UPI00340BBD27